MSVAKKKSEETSSQFGPPEVMNSDDSAKIESFKAMLTEVLKEIEEVFVSNDLKGLNTKLDRLENVKELDKLDKLDQLDRLDALSKLDVIVKLDNLKEMDQLDKLNKLDKLDALSKLDEITKLDNLKDLKELKELKELKKLDDLSKLEKLKELDRLDILRKIDDIGRLDELRELKSLDRLSELGILNNLTNLDRLENLKELEKLGVLKKLDSLDQLDSLNYLQNIGKLENILNSEAWRRIEELDKLEGILNSKLWNKVDQLQNLKELDKLDVLDKLDSLDKLSSLTELKNIEVLENILNSEPWEKIDRLNVLNEKKSILLKLFLGGLFMDFVKILVVSVILVFLVFTLVTDRQMTNIFANLKISRPAAVNIGLSMLEKTLLADQFENYVEYVKGHIDSRIMEYWDIDQDQNPYSRFRTLNFLSKVNYKRADLDLGKFATQQMEKETNNAKVHFDDLSDEIVEEYSQNPEEMVKYKQLSLLLFNDRCAEAYKTSLKLEKNSTNRHFLNLVEGLAIECLYNKSKIKSVNALRNDIK